MTVDRVAPSKCFLEMGFRYRKCCPRSWMVPEGLSATLSATTLEWPVGRHRVRTSPNAQAQPANHHRMWTRAHHATCGLGMGLEEGPLLNKCL
jgi:hypothetical protein